jgi:hypothetical protein
VTAERDATLIEAFRAAEAEYRMYPWRSRDLLVSAAAELLAAGIGTSGVTALAGDDRAESDELEHDLDRALAELGLQPLGRAEAAIWSTRSVAIAVVNGQISTATGASRVWDHFRETDYAAGPLAVFASSADGFISAPEYVSEDDFKRAAAEFVAAFDQAPGG